MTNEPHLSPRRNEPFRCAGTLTVVGCRAAGFPLKTSCLSCGHILAIHGEVHPHSCPLQPSITPEQDKFFRAEHVDIADLLKKVQESS